MSYLGSRYELLELIGSGAMGEVWRARVRPDAPVIESSDEPEELAVKLLHPNLVQDPDVVRRFVQERSILIGLKHPGIVRIVDMVAERDKLGIVMELVPGGTLNDSLKKRGTLKPAAAAQVSCAVLDALAYAHSKGVLHRDVKPANVLLGVGGLDDPAAAKLSDFGIASFTDEYGAHATGLVGSPAFMSPEQFTDGVVTAASDVYAAGIMLYEMLAGRTPFAGHGSATTIGLRHVTVTPPRLPVDDRLWAIVASMLAKAPAARPSAAYAASEIRALPAESLWGDALQVQPEPKWSSLAAVSAGLTGIYDPTNIASPAQARLEVSDPSTPVAPKAEITFVPTETPAAPYDQFVGQAPYATEPVYDTQYWDPAAAAQKPGLNKLVIVLIALAVAVAVTAGVLIYHFTRSSDTPVSPVQTPTTAANNNANKFDVPPADMLDCATINWSYGGSYPTAVAFGKWNDAAGGENWLLICQGSSGYGISRGGPWASDALAFFEIIESSAGVFQANFTGGDLGGVTVLLSPDGTYQVAGGSTGHLSSTSGWQPLVEGYFPHGSGSSNGPAGQTSISNDAATQQVLNLQSQIWQNASVRDSLSSYIESCDSNGIGQVLTSRQDFLVAVQTSAVDQIPNGYQLQSVLISAIQYSIQSDQTYLNWAQQGCPKPVPAPQSDTDAGDAKDQFVAMWNSQIAGRYPGAEQLTAAQL